MSHYIEEVHAIKWCTQIIYIPCIMHLTTWVVGWFTLWTMKLDRGRWPSSMVWLMVQLPWYDFLKKQQHTKSLGSLLGVNRMWTKKYDHAPKSECANFLIYMPKKGSFEKKFKFHHSPLFSWTTCLHFLLNVSKLWLANILTTIFTKNERFNLYMFNVIYMWHVPCVVTSIKHYKKEPYTFSHCGSFDHPNMQ